MSASCVVYIVDDNLEQAEATTKLLARQGFETEVFESGEQFLTLNDYPETACLLLDNHMPGGMSGLDVQTELTRRGTPLPIVFMSGDNQFKHVVKAMKSGAHEYLQKPFSSTELYESIHTAIREKKPGSMQHEEKHNEKLDKLTAREKQVLELLALGYTNRMISEELSIVVSTVEFHRANLTNKLGAKSLADLIAIQRSV
ncbi:MAG TPA: DNA-binding response regulator [Gammaproteobacteria bacterium]|jgi:FixJ family two-component response regulator|nr:response regulator [Gammaproteobacteria bacterium]MDP6732544.1 response regulator [Gammaproteobacteria bacterium]HAJ76321.1 DNA-binding response regulator [Gammaproteobacteria bacterium]|tara:strand:- start:1412 stop:2011 length:600 start_codon:yes stop_codon:yes gene_type:complete